MSEIRQQEMDNYSCVVLPVLNEKDNLKILLPKLSRYVVYVVDDGSKDGTIELCSEFDNVILIERGEKKGLVSAVLDGMREAIKSYDYIVVSDADLSHDPKYIAEMVSDSKRMHADLVIGSRYMSGGRSQDKWTRQLISKGANTLFKLSFSRRVKDATSGYRVYSKAAAMYLIKSNSQERISNSYAGQIDILQRLLRSNFRVEEHPITFTTRKVGESKLSANDMKAFALLSLRKGHLSRYVGVVAVALILNQAIMSFTPSSISIYTLIITIPSALVMGLMRHAHTDRTKPPLYISLRRVRTFYDRFAGLALISVLVNAIVFAIMIRSGINFLLADFVGNISAVCLTYLTIP